MKISQTKSYSGASDKLCRLGLAETFVHLQEAIFDTKVYLSSKRKPSKGVLVSRQFAKALIGGPSWRRDASGKWIGQFRYEDQFLSRLGLEIQISSRSDLLIRDIVHLRNSLQEGVIDIGVIVVPDDEMQVFLTDRTPSYRDAVRYIEKEFKEATTFPIIIIAIEHDGISDTALPKKKTNLSATVSEIKPIRRTRRRT